MDYSLLVGIQTVTERRVFRPAPQRGAGVAGVAGVGGGPPLRSSSSIAAALSRDAAAGSSVVVQAEGQQQCGPLGYSAETLQGPGNYRLGIIDPLQRWDMRKRLERLLKIMVRPRRAATLKTNPNPNPSPTPNLNPNPSPNPNLNPNPNPNPNSTPNQVRLRCAAKLKNGMSAVEPAEYARRFHQMVRHGAALTPTLTLTP